MRIEARAKINWTLNIVGKREDDYHLLDMILQKVTLCDLLDIGESADGALSLSLSHGSWVPQDGDNLTLRAAKLLKEDSGCEKGARIYLEKHIPVGAGLGGGSADAAAVLTGLNEMWNLNYPPERLRALGLRIGADVPYMLCDTPARVGGVGETLSPLQCRKMCWLVIVKPGRGLSTREVFSAYDGAGARPDNDRAEKALCAGDYKSLYPVLGNALEETAARLRPEITLALRDLRERGARAARMTGSGCCVFGVFIDEKSARAAARSLRLRWPFARAVRTV